jgi:hypothetical protein
LNPEYLSKTKGFIEGDSNFQNEGRLGHKGEIILGFGNGCYRTKAVICG